MENEKLCRTIYVGCPLHLFLLVNPRRVLFMPGEVAEMVSRHRPVHVPLGLRRASHEAESSSVEPEFMETGEEAQWSKFNTNLTVGKATHGLKRLDRCMISSCSRYLPCQANSGM